MDGTSMKVPEGHRMITRASYRYPVDDWDVLLHVRIVGRSWWQFWLPKTIHVYTMTVPYAKAERQEE